MLPLKIDQIAYASYSDADTMAIKFHLGLDNAEWVEDFVVAEGTVNGEPGWNEARLLFNYDNGIEVEILQYLAGPNYLTAQRIPPGRVCHIGMHFNGERGVDIVPSFNAPIIQQVETLTHTNPFLLSEGRKYRYTIYDTIKQYGVNYKVIERLS